MSDTTSDRNEPLTKSVPIDEETVPSIDQYNQMLSNNRTEDVQISNKTAACIEDEVIRYNTEAVHNGDLYENNSDSLMPNDEVVVEGNEVEISTNDDGSKFEEGISANEEVSTSNEDEVSTDHVVDHTNEAVYSVTEDVTSNDKEIVSAGEFVISTNENDVSSGMDVAVNDNISVTDEQVVAFDEQSVVINENEGSTCEISTETNDTIDVATVSTDENIAIANEIEVCSNLNISQDQEPSIETVVNENIISNDVPVDSERHVASIETAETSILEPIKAEFIKEEPINVFEKETTPEDEIFVLEMKTNGDDEETNGTVESMIAVNDDENVIFGDMTSQDDESFVVQTSALVDDPSAGETVEQIEAELDKSYESSTDNNSVSKELQNKTESTKSKPKACKRPNHIPPHLMGRDIANPTEDLIGTGRRIQKPRLGVKVPYRNLTSQIVSQDEIAQEIFERTRRKFKYYESVETDDILSSLKLPQRISKKINVAEVIKKKTQKEKSISIEPLPSSKPVETSKPDNIDVSTENTSNIDSKVEELYAEISSTLAEDCPMTEAIAKSNPVKRAADSSTSLNSTAAVLAAASKVVNGDSVPPNANSEASLDHDTLLAILEDTPETVEMTTSTNVSITTIGSITTSTPKTNVATSSSSASKRTVPSAKRQKRIRVTLDPNVEKELALKQLMDFEVNSKRGRKPRSLQMTQKSPENGVISGHNSTTPNSSAAVTGANESAEKKTKRCPIYSSAPKRFPKKYHRIIKRQLRDSKMKAKTINVPTLPEPTPQPQKKLPEVPEVQIAIDRYIKTYASKRKRQSDDKTTENPPEKKTREDVSSTQATSSNESSSGTTRMEVDAIPKSTPIVRKSPVASTSIASKSPIVRKSPVASTSIASKSPATLTPKTAAAAAAASSTPKSSAAVKKRTPVASTSKSPIAASSKTTLEVAKPKVNSRMMREINRLLGDEGAINMIYSIEQRRSAKNKSGDGVASSPRNRIKKDLESKTKMVKNAVLRLSMASSPEAVSRRRISPETSVADGNENDSVVATTSSPKAKPAPTPIIAAGTSDMPVAKTKAPEPAPLLSVKQRRLLAAEASRIIRRHSSSSSSGDEEPNSCVPITEARRPSSSAVEANINDGVTKQKKDVKTKSPKSRRESKVGLSDTNETSTTTTVISNNSYEIRNQSSYKEISLRIYDNLVHIVFASTTVKMKNAVNLQMLRELIDVLRELEKEERCKVVLMTSAGSTFCQGVDLTTLMCTNQTERAEIVDKYVATLTDFTKRLSEFPKILIAGVQGRASGLGVTMLPFFDMVFASDKASFKTPHMQLGQIPEAGATIMLPSLLGNAIAKELFFGRRTLTADEALQFGLIVRKLQSNKLDEELLSFAKSIASHSSQSIAQTKMLLRRVTTSKLDEQLELEAKLLKEQWCSEECQRRFEEYLQQETVTTDN